ncbi:MAG: hypothetical protein IJT02_05525 [Synergistaceae bacterium]|nr:hypothetical protein [Synergistaceae bacterium]
MKEEKYTGPLLTDCSIYQLGMNEFIIRLNGKKLPRPEAETDNNSLVIFFDGARASNPEEIASQVSDSLESVPMLYNFEIENLSGDQISIQLDASYPLKIHKASRTAGGWSFRVQADASSQALPDVFSPPPKLLANAPTTSLPFTAKTRTTIEFREAELQDVFRLFMAALGRNIVLDASFPRDTLVTMTLIDVRIDEIMNYMLRTYDLACYNYGPNITAFGTREGLYKLSGAREIKTFRIAYAEPATVSTMLQTLTGIQASEIVIDERMRTLYVNTNPAKMDEVEDLIGRIDTPARQVMIRASIFEFSDAATKDVQKSLNMVYDKWSLLSNPATGTGTLTFEDYTYSQGRSALDRYITAAFSALETRNKGRTIANPSVIAIDGQEATITLKQDIMYSAGRDDSGNPTWSTTEVGPELKFTPKIEDNGYINLKITINTGDYLGSDSDGNIITTDRNVETTIRVRDGMPFVVGGLFQDINNNIKNKIPVLGDIPLLGELFTYRSKNRDKTQAVMLVTPYILDMK